MEIRLDHDAKMPIYLQIVHTVKHQIATGRLLPGARLPTQRELAGQLHVDPNTIARAYDQLDADRVISTQQGRGTFVREQPDEPHLDQMRAAHLQTLVNHMIQQTYALGYSEAELRAALRQALTSHRAESRRTTEDGPGAVGGRARAKKRRTHRSTH